MRNAYDLTAPDPSLPPDRWLPAGIEKLLDYVEENADAFRAVYSGRQSVDEDIRAALREGRDAQIKRMCEYISPGEKPSETLRLGMEGWIAMLDVLMLEWIDGREIEREQLVKLASGALAGTVASALLADGRADRLTDLRHLIPDVFKGI